MSWIGRAFSSVSSYYKEINPATLSGAIDIIVVCRSSTEVDSDTGEQKHVDEFACSPWHVRFGKLSVLRPVERKVIIEVNGEQVPFSMKISETGEAYFVFETSAPVPSELQTSPLVEAVSDAEIAANAQREQEAGHAGALDALEAVPDFDDLGESRATVKNEFQHLSEPITGAGTGDGLHQGKPDGLAFESPKSSAPSDASTGITVPSSRETTPAHDDSKQLASESQDPGSATPASSSSHQATPRQSGSSTPKEADDGRASSSSSGGPAKEDKAPGFLKAPVATAAVLGRAAISGVTRDGRMDKVVKKRSRSKDGKTTLERRLSEMNIKDDDDDEPVSSRAEGEGHNTADGSDEVGALDARMREDLSGRRDSSASGRDGGGAGGQEGEDVRRAARAQRARLDIGVPSHAKASVDENGDVQGPGAGRSAASEGGGPGDGSTGMNVATGPHSVEKAQDMFTSGPGPQIGPDPITVTDPEGESAGLARSSSSGGRRPRGRSHPSRPAMSRSTSAVSTKSQRHHQDELMLDMDGYKLRTSDDAKAAEMGRALLAASTDGHDPDDESVAATAQGVTGSGPHDGDDDPASLPDGGVAKINLDNAAGKAIARGITGHHGLPDEEEVMAFTRALLRSADRMRPKDIAGEHEGGDEEEGASKYRFPLRANSPGAGSDVGSPPPSTATSPQLRPVLDSEEPQGPALSDNVSAINAASVPYQFSLRADGTVHIFELSLCGDDHFGHASEALDAQAFQDRKVSFGQFIDQPDVVNHQALVMKYHGRYLTWENASPVLASLAIYRKSLPEDYAKNMQEGIPNEGTPTSAGAEKRSYRPWARWWTKSRSDTVLPLRQETSPTTSPRPSPPPSPRSLPVMDEDKNLPPAPEEVLPSNDTSLATELPDADVKPTKNYAKTLRLTSDQLRQLNLKKGLNHVSFSVRSSYSGYAICTSRIFLWDGDYQVCISDIDGTITKSDALGHVFTMIGRDWTHAGVAKLYTDIARNGYQIMYLTSRAIGQADTTREYLKGINQSGFVLPDGPVIMSPDRLMTSLHREVIMRKPEVFKMACLRDIQRLFSERNPFYAGFGNRITDALSYRSVDVPSSRIFTIDSNGDVKMELLELAGYRSSYIHMTDLVDQMFPPINRKAAPDFTDFNFWRAPLPTVDLPDLAPPSPALSARSGDSRLSFPRLGSISLGRTKSPRPDLEKQASNGSGRTPIRGHRAHPSSPLVRPVYSDEPDALSLESLDEGDEGDSYAGRDRSDSMPGSLPGSLEEASLHEFRKRRPLTEAEEYRQAIELRRREEGREDSADFGERDAEDADDDDFPQMDFSSVPYL